MLSINCLIGNHKKVLILKETTIEKDDSSGVTLKRNVYFCESCNKRIYERTDGVAIKDKGFTWVPTDYYF